MRVQIKLIFGFLTISILVGLVGFVPVYESSKALEKAVSESTLSLVNNLVGDIDKDINSKIEEYKAYSKDLILQEFVSQSNMEFEKLSDIQGYINQKDKEWISSQKSEITPFMQQLIDSKLSEELREKTKFYEDNYGYKLYGEVFLTNKYGANAAETGKTTDYRQDDEDWWQKTKENGVYVENVKYDDSADVYSTAIGIRIDDENGNFIGVVKVVLNIAQTINIIKEAEAEKKYSSEEFTLVDGQGKIIFSTREYNIFEPYGMFQDIKEHSGYFKFKDAQTGAEKLLVHAHSKGYKNFKSLGWILAVDLEKDDILKPINSLAIVILSFAFISILFALIIGFYIYSTISKPLKKFEDVIGQISEGNLDSRVEIKTKDEFSALAETFNKMAGELKDLKRLGILKKTEKELEAIEASHKIGFISEESYGKAKKRLTEILEKPANIDARLLKEKGFIK